MKTTDPRLPSGRSRGQVLVLFALLLLALLGISALAIDYASWLVVDRNLQNAADHAALAGASAFENRASVTNCSGTKCFNARAQAWTSLNDDPNGYGKLMTDPTDPKGLFIPLDPGSGAGVDVSRDDGQTWTTYQVPGTKAQPHTAITSVGVSSARIVTSALMPGLREIFLASKRSIDSSSMVTMVV